jgi:hypothetical protein
MQLRTRYAVLLLLDTSVLLFPTLLDLFIALLVLVSACAFLRSVLSCLDADAVAVTVAVPVLDADSNAVAVNDAVAGNVITDADSLAIATDTVATMLRRLLLQTLIHMQLRRLLLRRLLLLSCCGSYCCGCGGCCWFTRTIRSKY